MTLDYPKVTESSKLFTGCWRFIPIRCVDAWAALAPVIDVLVGKAVNYEITEIA